MSIFKKPITWLCIALALMLISSIGASAIQTDFGGITITDVSIPMPNGETLRVLVHRPDTATVDNPAPAVIVSHGYHATLETQDITSIELARRGFVVFNMDTYSAGESSGTTIAYGASRSYYGLGMLQLVDYVHDNINYIDPERIGITGHSTGGRNVVFTLDAYGRNENGLEYVGQPADASSYETKVSSALILAYFPEEYLINNFPSDVNIGINFAKYDEGAPSQITPTEGYMIGDMTVAPEAKFFINGTNPDEFTMNIDEGIVAETGFNDAVLTNLDANEKLEISKYYGDIDNGTMRVVYNPDTSHQWQFFSITNATITNQYFMDTLGAPNPIEATDQLWLLKEIFNGIGLIGFFMLLIPLALLLMKTPFFESLSGKPAYLKAPPNSGKSKAIFGISLLLLAAIPGLSVMFAFSDLAYGTIFTDGTRNNSTAFLPQPGFNGIIVWAVLNAIIAIAIFAIGYYLNGKKEGDNPDNWGIKTSAKQLGKSALLAFIVMSASYICVLLADIFFKTDFRFWSFAVKAANGYNLTLWIRYLPFMLFFWLITSFMVNASAKFETKKPWHNTALCIFVNIIGLVAVVAIQFIVLFSTGTPMWHLNRAWVNVCLIIPFIPMMAIGTVVLRKAYNNTGSIYLGGFIMAFVSTIVTVSTATTILFV